MPRKVAYVLITKTGPSREEQLAAIRKTAWRDMKPHDVVYEDFLKTKGQLKREEYPQRDLMLRQLRPGDMIVVASPGRLGLGKERVMEVLEAIWTKECSVIDAGSSLPLTDEPEIANALSFLDRSVLEHKQYVAAAARRAKEEAGIRGGRPKSKYKLSEAELRRRWYNQADHPMQKQIAEDAGVSVRTLYANFGPRSGLKSTKRSST